ncbi:Vacuolar protein sorting-associated protein 72 homolog [Eumeta japonica]|uniref:Vacuolar protein sorting-associated protein 72 homolog n=1 Tax=Eumeta variegata TaxID=151549 RepID=A0A4C1ZGW0_EUMVA|nr:Vacuolar protein sorting-associated protein 72 homolog [Eumeta japonica]
MFLPCDLDEGRLSRRAPLAKCEASSRSAVSLALAIVRDTVCLVKREARPRAVVELPRTFSCCILQDPKLKRKLVLDHPKKDVKKPKEEKPKTRKRKGKNKDGKIMVDIGGRKSIRQSTAVKSAETQQRIKIRSELKKKKPRRTEDKMPSQEELLAEAVITEEENLKKFRREAVSGRRRLAPPLLRAVVTNEMIMLGTNGLMRSSRQGASAQFEQTELERKKARPAKKTIHGPRIKLRDEALSRRRRRRPPPSLRRDQAWYFEDPPPYHSFAVPMGTEMKTKETKEEASARAASKAFVNDSVKSEDDKDQIVSADDKANLSDDKLDLCDSMKMDSEQIDIIGPDEEVMIDGDLLNKSLPKSQENKNGSYFERTLLTFENDINNEAFENAFPQKRPKRKLDMLCAVTKRPARYIDPLTKLPYSCIDAFRIIREAYYQQLEAIGDRSKPEIAEWLKWRQAEKKSRYVHINVK